MFLFSFSKSGSFSNCMSSWPLHVKKQVFYNLQTDLGTWIPNTASGECGVKLTTTQIIGGDKALFGEFPYMALLGYVVQKQMKYLCSGSVLNTKYVLTAAHCHEDQMGFIFGDRAIRWDFFVKVLSPLEACIDLISGSSLHKKIQIMGGTIAENLGSKSLLRRFKIFFILFSQILHKKLEIFVSTIFEYLVLQIRYP